ncbi:hypothetical protein LCGC14_0629540 [marine sediment metagenome]|uniref:Capsid protein n=1 Tax=marine sediment metagenome TaxID=412755 RepID=A0A0F9R7N8_9ZZZZ
MAISARIPSGLDDKKFIPKLYSRNVLIALKNKLVVVPVVNHSYEPELVMGDTLYIPATNTVAATEVTIGTEGTQKNPFNTSAVTLTIDKYFEAPITVDYMSRRQSQVNLVSKSEDESAYAISKKIDSTLCDLFSALNGGTVRGGDGAAWTDNVLIAAVEELDEEDVPEVNRVWVSDPSVKADILKIDKFTRNDYFASDAVVTGMFRKDIYGAPLLVTNNLTAVTSGTGSYGVYMHRDALAIAIQQNLDVDRVEQPLKHQIVINTTALWGVVELRDISGVPIYTRLA